ncbi:MAG: J domain-containing protein [Rickettsiales bacterium]
MTTLHQRAHKQEEIYLRARLAHALKHIEMHARATLALELELTSFIETYYAAVGEYVEKLVALESELEGTPNANEEEFAAITSAMHDAAKQAQLDRANELKKRYRTLAKHIHPDVQSTEDYVEAAVKMQEVNEAYDARDLAKLVRLQAEWTLENILSMPEDIRLPELRAQLIAVEKASSKYQQERLGLMHSPVYELMLRATSARMAGRDWIAAVVHKIKTQIALKERTLVTAKLEAISDWRHQHRAAVA